MALYRARDIFGTLVAETILASVHVRAQQQAGHMDASDLIQTLLYILRVLSRLAQALLVARGGVS
jgi:hypothetical protein